MVVLALLVGLMVGWLVGWRLTSRSYQTLVTAQDEQTARLIRERRELRSDVKQLRQESESRLRLVEKAEKAIATAKKKRDSQAQLIIELTDAVQAAETDKDTEDTGDAGDADIEAAAA